MLEQKRILLLEDSDIFADMLLEFLTGLGYAVERAANGFEGLKAVYTFLPRLIITDVDMPLFKGYQVSRLLKSRKNTRDIPIIMFTTLAEKRNKFWGSQAGADWYIEKSPDNFVELQIRTAQLLVESAEPDFEAIAREGRRINHDAIIEMVNNLLDNKLFQTTVIGMLTELSTRIRSLDEIIRGFFDLLCYVCEAEIAMVMIKRADNSLHVYTANQSGYTPAIEEDFTAIAVADFNTRFPDFQVLAKHRVSIYPAGEKQKPLESYVMIPLAAGGEQFATVHIANSIKEYFSPSARDNLDVFLFAAAPVIANALSLLEMEALQQKTRAAFARYVPVEVMDEIIRKSSEAASQSETRNVVILFSDIRDFTKISESTSAQDIVSFLNAYFSLMGNEVIAEGGHIDKFMGDAIMAVFGAPKALAQAEAAAIRAAIRMTCALDRVNTSRIALPPGGFAAGIGINCGECVVGNIGFQDRMDYTVIGDAVNTASRLEGITRQYRHPVIVSEYLYSAARDHFIFRKADTVRVKGKDEPVGIYAVYAAYAGEAGEETGAPGGLAVPPSLTIRRELLDCYNKGLHLFALREWEAAQSYFAQALAVNQEDYLCALYLERSAEFLKNPPPDGWDSAITLREK
ncbi:MAG: response regulator [Treponema sp.]|jgi:class 3 adenylate cyclase/DNA-binding response OmpR family regulator|nr:response regulator [Treponema sp.]